jgi:hypothetical protein
LDKNFLTLWRKWKFQHLFSSKTYKFRYSENIWEDINIHPFDLSLDKLAQIYLEASSTGKADIEKYVQRRDGLSWALVLYIRRAALRLQSKEEDILAYWAMGIALLASKSDDVRDIVISLMLLKVGAEKIGVDLKPLYNKIDPSGLTYSKSIFYKAENQPNNSLIYAIKKFGPPEWSHQLP